MTFGHVAKRLDWKDTVDFKFYDVTTCLTSSCPILPNISRSKDNQTMKFDWLIEYNMKNFVFERSYTECCEETNNHIWSVFFVTFTVYISRKFNINTSLSYLFWTTCFCQYRSSFDDAITKRWDITHDIGLWGAKNTNFLTGCFCETATNVWLLKSWTSPGLVFDYRKIILDWLRNGRLKGL